MRTNVQGQEHMFFDSDYFEMLKNSFSISPVFVIPPPDTGSHDRSALPQLPFRSHRCSFVGSTNFCFA
jgi:hypothetical protein